MLVNSKENNNSLKKCYCFLKKKRTFVLVNLWEKYMSLSKDLLAPNACVIKIRRKNKFCSSIFLKVFRSKSW